MFMQARFLLPARLPCQFQPVPYADGRVLVLAAGLVAPAPVVRADPSGPWWTKDIGAIIKVAPCAALYCGTLLWLKETHGPAARPKPMSSTKMRAGIEVLIDLAPGILNVVCKSETFTKAQASPRALAVRP
jgi:Uncharacterized protein conserved in bacteria (DUF2147)